MPVSTACARTLVDELARAGLTDAVLAPGSRSAPLALALADDDRLRLHVVLDERSAAFFALGAARAAGRPTLVLCTSGTAAAHFHPAVLEAHHSRVPLIVCTADRPAELRATGAPQTTDQVHLYGSAVRFFADLPADGDPAARAAWRPVAARVWAEAAGPPAGPVHLNVAFREPLVPAAGAPEGGAPTHDAGGAREADAAGAGAPAEDGAPGGLAAGARAPGGLAAGAPSDAGAPGALAPGPPDAGSAAGTAGTTDDAEPGRPGGRPWLMSHRPRPAALTGEAAAGLGERMRVARRGLLVAGWGSTPEAAAVAGQLGWPLLADAISGLRHCPQAVTAYEALLRVPGFAEAHRPDLVIRFGGPLTSKVATAWLDSSVPQVLVDPDGAWLDPQRTAAERVPALPAGGGESGRAEGVPAHPAVGSEGSAAGRVPARPAAAGEGGGAARPDGTLAGWFGSWLRAEGIARRALDAFLDGDDRPFEGRVARDVAAVCAAYHPSAALVVASSMPVRDLEAFAGVVPPEVHANRGVNGIDGLVSTVLGVAAGRPRQGVSAELVRRAVVGLLGDLAFLHDAGGLLGAPGRGLDAVFVVVDNGGGGIFSFLPQAALPDEKFELLFGTPPGVDVGKVAEAYGVPAERVERATDVAPALEAALAAGGVRVLAVSTGDRTANVDRHRQAWAAVAEAIGGR